LEPQVGPYRIVERLGAGGMGEVYLAEDTRLGRQVALKRLTDSSLGDAAARVRILREAGAAATLNHPNVAAVYDVLDSDGRAYIVMEYVPGESLADQLHHQGPLSTDRVVQIGMQLCDALAEAHRHHIVHRDLKPANVRVTPDGRVKVLDFGLAKRRGAVAAVTPGGERVAVAESLALSEGQVIGTPTYMAPEVLLGQAADHRSDIYSLGVTLFELAVGYTPFDGTNFLSIALAVLTEPPPPITTMLPGGLGEIVAKCMARDQSQRYQSAVALRRDLASLSAEMFDRPTGPLHVPSSARARLLGSGMRSSTRTKVLVGLATVVLLAAAGVLTASLWRPAAAPAALQSPVVAVVALPTVSDNPAYANLGLGVAAELGGYLSNSYPRATIVNSNGVPVQVQTAGVFSAGRGLGATFLVPVQAQVQGGRVQVNAQLVRVENQALLGSITERGSMGDAAFFDLQQRLGAGVAGLLTSAVGLSKAAGQRSTGASSVNDFAEYSAAIAMLERRFVAGNVDQATSILEGVVARSPGFAAAHAGLSSAYLTQFREAKSPALVDKSIASAQRAVDLDPADTRGLTSLALGFAAAGRSNEAIQTLRVALERQPRSDDLHRELGDILVRSGQIEAGLNELRAASQLRPDYWENSTALAMALYMRGRFDEAIAPFTRAAELMPTDPLAHQRLASTYHQLGRLDEALTHYRAAIRNGGTPSAYANIGTILYRQGKFAEALTSYDESLKIRPGSHQTWRSKGDTLNRLGRPDEAREAWRKAADLAENMLKANTADAHARGFLAVCHAKLGEVETARSLAAQAMQDAPGNPDVIYRNAVVNALTGRIDEGRDLLDRALKAGYSASEAAIDDDLRALGPPGARAAK
jgi:eukaryotic-like serine/threonine-protein kinase